MRNNTIMGPAEVSPGFPVSCEAHTTIDTVLTLYPSDPLCADLQYPPIQQRGTYEPWQQWCQQDKGTCL